jgi:acetoin utilization deacetylase AcuC-like enzyme
MKGFIPNETLFYGSTHEKDNYPGTGAEPRLIGTNAVRDQDRRIVNRYLDAGEESKPQFRVKWAQIIEEMERFSPELIIFSAGFDAHTSDPLGGCSLLEEDFAWATEIVMQAAVRLRPMDPVPCVSILEGGYNLKAISASAVAHCSVLKDWPIRAAIKSSAVAKESLSTPPRIVASGKEVPTLWTDESEEAWKTNQLPLTDDVHNRLDLNTNSSTDIRDVTDTIFKLSVR